MNEEEIIVFLKENLSIFCKEKQEIYSSCKYVEIKLCLCGEEISTAYFNLPTND